MDHKNNFNLLRLAAACQVVFTHSHAHLELPANSVLITVLAQFPGVACFFVISGFLVTDSCLRSNTGDFFRKRARRIYPALAVNIVTLEFLVLLTGGHKADSWLNYFTVYIPTYVITASDQIASQYIVINHNVGWFFSRYPSGVLWTLTVELTFYALLPVILSIARRSRRAGTAALALLIAISISFSATTVSRTFYSSHPIPNITVLPYLWIFSFGILARLYWKEAARLFENRILFWIALYFVVILVSCGIFNSPQLLDYKYTIGVVVVFRVLVLSGVVLSAAYSFTHLSTRAEFLSRNDFSYGLYLWHMLVVTTLMSCNLTGHWWLWPVVYSLGLALAAISWFWIEVPANSKPSKQPTKSASTTTVELKRSRHVA